MTIHHHKTTIKHHHKKKKTSNTKTNTQNTSNDIPHDQRIIMNHQTSPLIDPLFIKPSIMIPNNSQNQSVAINCPNNTTQYPKTIRLHRVVPIPSSSKIGGAPVPTSWHRSDAPEAEKRRCTTRSGVYGTRPGPSKERWI